MRFTDSYGEQSCTAGRSSFITGQSVYRTGLSKVGMPGADVGLQAEDVDDRRAAQAAGLRDRAVRQEPPRRPQQVPADRPRLRRVLRQPLPPQRRGGAGDGQLAAGGGLPAASTSASGRAASCTAGRPTTDDDTEDAALRARRPQRIEDTGPLTKKRMETIDDEVARRTRSTSSTARPRRTRRSSCWFNTTHMHLRTHPKPESLGQAGRWQSPYHDTMIDHDKHRRRAARQARRARASPTTRSSSTAPTTGRT